MSKRYLLATFSAEKDILNATRASRQRGLKIADVYSPYAVHGMETAMGLPPSRLTYACFLFGIAGVVAALVMQFWTSAVSWPINVGGRPWNSLPAFFPITFEMMVLFAGLGTVFVFFLICGLFPGKQGSAPVPAVTDDRFVLVLEQVDSTFDPVEVKQFLQGFHAAQVEEREVE